MERNENSIEPMAGEHEENWLFGPDGFSINYIVNPMIPHDSINTHTGVISSTSPKTSPDTSTWVNESRGNILLLLHWQEGFRSHQ